MEKALETHLLSSTEPPAAFQGPQMISNQVQQKPRASANPVERYAPLCSDYTLLKVFRSTLVMEKALETQLLSSTKPSAASQRLELISSQVQQTPRASAKPM